MIKILLTLMTLVAPVLVFGQTVKSNQEIVILYANPSIIDSEKVGEVKRFEEVEVLQTVFLPNRQKWYKVRLIQHPDWKKTIIEGWALAKYFFSIEKPTKIDQPTQAGLCNDCEPKTNQRVLDLRAVTDQIAKQPDSVKEKFIWPTTGIVRSGYGMRRHPITGKMKLHNGTDISGNDGRDVVAAKSGIVTTSVSGCIEGAKKCNNGAGNQVTIDHGDGTVTKYLHLNPKCELAPLKLEIKQGDKLGCVGNTGGSTGPHLHFIVLVNGKTVNPITVLPRKGK